MSEHVACRLRHRNDGPHMWEYYPINHPLEVSTNIATQNLTLQQLLDILNDDKHAGAQERPPEPHSPNVSVPVELMRNIWAEMYYGVGGESGIDDSIAQWNLDQVVEILSSVNSLPSLSTPHTPTGE